jgi:membrane protein DedA with SNARE-associated domain
LITKHPLLQMFLNPRNRYLVLASPQVSAIPFFVVGFTRLVLTDPLGYLLGYLYGDASLRWVERKLGEDPETGWISLVERWFGKASYVIVLIAPNLYICILAGATGMRPRVFITLNVLGTIGRLVLIRVVGHAFKDPLTDVLDFIKEYRFWLLALSIIVVSFQVWRGRKKGSLDFDTISEIEEGISEEIERLDAERSGEDGE